jgi:hypothetical protein
MGYDLVARELAVRISSSITLAPGEQPATKSVLHPNPEAVQRAVMGGEESVSIADISAYAVISEPLAYSYLPVAASRT